MKKKEGEKSNGWSPNSIFTHFFAIFVTLWTIPECRYRTSQIARGELGHTDDKWRKKKKKNGEPFCRLYLCMITSDNVEPVAMERFSVEA